MTNTNDALCPRCGRDNLPTEGDHFRDSLMSSRICRDDTDDALQRAVDKLEEAIMTKSAYDKNLLMDEVQKDLRALITTGEEKS